MTQLCTSNQLNTKLWSARKLQDGPETRAQLHEHMKKSIDKIQSLLSASLKRASP